MNVGHSFQNKLQTHICLTLDDVPIVSVIRNKSQLIV